MPPTWGFNYLDPTPGSTKVLQYLFMDGDGDRELFAAITEAVHGGAIMNRLVNCWGDTKLTAGQWEYTNDVALRQYTQDVYTKVYNPSKVVDQSCPISEIRRHIALCVRTIPGPSR